MSTRGLVGHIINGEKYGLYNHADSYPEGLGVRIIEFIRMYSPDIIKQNLERFSFKVPTTDTLGQGDAMNAYYEFMMIEPEDIMVPPSDMDFLSSASCEHAYIINFDTKELEYYQYQDNENEFSVLDISFDDIMLSDATPISFFS